MRIVDFRSLSRSLRESKFILCDASGKLKKRAKSKQKVRKKVRSKQESNSRKETGRQPDAHSSSRACLFPHGIDISQAPTHSHWADALARQGRQGRT